MFDSTNIDKIVPTLRRYSPSLDRMKKNHMEKLHWGIVPFWAKDTAIGSRMINARSETVATKTRSSRRGLPRL